MMCNDYPCTDELKFSQRQKRYTTLPGSRSRENGHEILLSCMAQAPTVIGKQAVPELNEFPSMSFLGQKGLI